MWFDNEEVSRRRRFKVKRSLSRNPILNVNARLSDKRRARIYRVAVIVLVPMVIAVVVVLAWFGLKALGGLLFSGNDRFTITNLEIKGGGVITRDFITGKKKISEGINLFAFSIGGVRDDFLRHAPNFKSMEITRHLPDTLKVEVIERVPLARIDRTRYLIADSEGCIFGLRSRLLGLPVIKGYKGSSLRPGSRIQGMALSAIEVLSACDDPKTGLHVASVDVGNREYIVVRLSNNKWGRLAWENMGEMSSESHEKLKVKLRQWVKALRTEKGKRDSEFDLTFDDKIYSR